MEERENIIAMHGNPLTLLGPALSVGQKAPDFKAVGNDLSEISLADYQGKTVVISAVPSLDTPVCDVQTRKFNEEAVKLGPDVAVLTISMDLPFAQARWCGAADVKNVTIVSDYQQADFGAKYGLLIKGLRLLTRAVLVIDKAGTIQYVAISPEITKEPDYDAALAATKAQL